MYSVDKIELNLIVLSIEDTVDWYEEVLGWKGEFDVFDEEDNCTFGSVSKDDEIINLVRSSDEFKNDLVNFTIFIHVDDVDDVFDRVVKNGRDVEIEPKDTFWGGRTFWIYDLNGYRLEFVEFVEDLDIDEIREGKCV